MAVDFKALLAKPLDEVKRPPAFPAGTYHGTLSKFEFGESRFGDKDTGEKHAIVKLSIVNVRPGDDVDVSLLVDAQGKSLELNKRPFLAEMPISGGNEYITKSLLEKLGVDCSGRGWGEVVPEAMNREVMFALTQRLDKDNPEVMYNDVRNLRAPPRPEAAAA